MENYICSNSSSLEDELDLEFIINKHANCIVKYCYNLLWDFHEAQDAAQEVFLTATVKLSGLRNTDNLKTWLYRIAHNICMDILRRKKRAKLLLSKVTENTAKEHKDIYDLGISRDLQNALNSLSPKDRALVFNRAVDQMDFSQIEKIYGVKSATLRKRYERARKKLEQQLRKDDLK